MSHTPVPLDPPNSLLISHWTIEDAEEFLKESPLKQNLSNGVIELVNMVHPTSHWICPKPKEGSDVEKTQAPVS